MDEVCVNVRSDSAGDLQARPSPGVRWPSQARLSPIGEAEVNKLLDHGPDNRVVAVDVFIKEGRGDKDEEWKCYRREGGVLCEQWVAFRKCHAGNVTPSSSSSSSSFCLLSADCLCQDGMKPQRLLFFCSLLKQTHADVRVGVMKLILVGHKLDMIWTLCHG